MVGIASAPKLAALTGATGFLGRSLARQLQADGFRVRILARRDPAGIPHDELVRGDLADHAALSGLCAGADVVVHAAGLVKARSFAAFHAVNVEGARSLAAAAGGVPHVLLVSSLAAREPRLSHYAATKRQAEEAMGQALGERITIARPCAIYGPGDREMLPAFRAAAASPVLPVISERARVAMIHVEDAARQIAALAAGPPAGRAFVLTDGRPDGYSWRELMSEAARAAGRTPRLIRAPRGLVRLIGFGGDLAAASGSAPMLTSGKARELLHPDWSVSRAEQSPSLPAPRYGLPEGFAETAAWYRSAGWMKQ